MKILHIKGGRPLSGVGSFILNMSREMPNVEFDYLLNGEDYSNEFDYKVNSIKSEIFIAPKLNHILKYILFLKKFYKENARNYDIVHIHSPNVAIFNYYFAKKNGLGNIVLHSHNASYSDSFIKSIRNFVLIYPLKFCKLRYLACGEKASKFLFRKKSNEAEIIYNGIDLETFKFNSDVRNEEREKLGIANKQVIGHIGNFTKQKNYEFILDLVIELSKKQNDFIVVLVGDGKERERIKEKAVELNLLEYIMFTGKVNDIEKYINSFDLMILPSKFEGFPYVCIEAQAIGVPVLLSDKIDMGAKINDNVNFLELDLNIWTKFILDNKFCFANVDEKKFEKFNSSNQSAILFNYYENVLIK